MGPVPSDSLERWVVNRNPVGVEGGAGVLIRMKAYELGKTAFESQLSAAYQAVDLGPII